MSPSEARSILDGVINYEFSDINRYLKDTELDTIHFTAPVTNVDGYVALNDLVDIYDNFASIIGDDTNFVNYFMINYPRSNTRNSDVEIVFTRGIIPPDPEPYPVLDYFEVDEDWIWGGNNGNCDHTITSGDATTELTRKSQAMLNPNRTRDWGDSNYVINPWIYDVELISKNYNDLQSCVSGIDWWLFHAEGLTPEEASTYCITSYYLNLYLRNVYIAVIRESGCFHHSPNYHSPIREIRINEGDDNGETLKDIWHYSCLNYYKTGNIR